MTCMVLPGVKQMSTQLNCDRYYNMSEALKGSDMCTYFYHLGVITSHEAGRYNNFFFVPDLFKNISDTCLSQKNHVYLNTMN